ncbi:uncharacterized protein LAESUDRAFT_740990 [Laetiporus sulphureus 93-53]|uniref:Telomere length regulation protein conserved domain-containing protein n=1 Tax=Laetiporus sulphureus 93-53 TaxID=1314785 RepID=A0A165HBS7_9APHY|nr:uncharacterized protein LAESUDRAFT_740990 [Laetiporus sulphureus 93-53]KZT11519.1 hypothetical protein LAESUDRAFT_740990 [Laetiporus sulphureus 93-53]
MSAEYADATLAQIRDVIARLQSPIPDSTALLQLLAAPLACLSLLPPRFRRYDVSPLPKESFNIIRHVPLLQRALLEHVVPTWEQVLVQEDAFALVEQYFCPDAMSFGIPAAGQVAVLAYSTLLSSPVHEPSVRLLVRLSRAYPIDVLHTVVYAGRDKAGSGKQQITWEDCVRNVAALPGKVANVLGAQGAIPPELEYGTYVRNLSVRSESLIAALCSNPSGDNVSSVIYLLNKLVNIGIFPPSRPTSPSQPSFFKATLPKLRERVSSDPSYPAFWRKLLSSLPSSLTLHSIITSLCSALEDIQPPLDPTEPKRALVKREAQLLRDLLGKLTKDNSELLDAFSAVALGREWGEGHARIFACWAAGAESGARDREDLEVVLFKVVDVWANPDQIRHSLLSRHRYLTSLLLLILSSFGPNESGSPSAYQALAHSPPFLTSISTYIAHLDATVRRCGMLVAEEVARGAGKKLDFRDWEGDEDGKDWCRQLRVLTEGCDADAEMDAISNQEDESEEGTKSATAPAAEQTNSHGNVPKKVTVQETGYDSDDSLTGYASPPHSFRSPSPTPSELEEIEKDPTLRVGQKKVPRPVYLAQLGEMVRGTSGVKSEEEEFEVQKIEVALDVAEELIRRKRAYGTELEETAITLVHGFLGLQDNYDIDDFEKKRQAALNALVACCPRKAAPALIEELFRNQYSVSQRDAALNALALGAGELASISIPSVVSPLAGDRVSFPSKRLPAALHKKYITADDKHNANNAVQLFVDDLSRKAIDKGAEPTAEKLAAIVRERQLRLRQPDKVTELPSSRSAMSRLTPQTAQPKRTTFTEVAAEYFICPLINHFWLFLRDEHAREALTAHQPTLHRYRGAGTGLVLNAKVMTRFLSTLALLVHAARNAREWLAIIAPDALELAVTLGTRPISLSEIADDEDMQDDVPSGASDRPGDTAEPKEVGKEAAILTCALQLALIVLDGALDLDGGRSLGLEHTALLLGAGEWAGTILMKLRRGTRVLGGGGLHEAMLKRSAAGVALKVDELSSRWGRSMIDLGSL